MTNEDGMKEWSDRSIRIPQVPREPDALKQKLEDKAANTRRGITPQYRDFLNSPEGKRYLEERAERVHELRSAWGRIGNAIRWGHYNDAIILWRSLEREDKAQAIISQYILPAPPQEPERRIPRGMGGRKPKPRIPRGM